MNNAKYNYQYTVVSHNKSAKTASIGVLKTDNVIFILKVPSIRTIITKKKQFPILMKWRSILELMLIIQVSFVITYFTHEFY